MRYPLPRCTALPMALTLTLFATLATAGSIAALVVPDQGQATLEAPAERSAQTLCTGYLERLGAQWESASDKKRLEITAELDSPRAAIERAEAILRGCPGYQLVDLCAGAECSPALSLALEYRGR